MEETQPLRLGVQSVPTAPEIQMKKCPCCYQEIRFNAKFCRFCGYRLVPVNNPDPQNK